MLLGVREFLKGKGLIESDMAQSTSKAKSGLLGQKPKFLVGIVLILASISYLIFTAFQSYSVYYFKVSELNGQSLSLEGKSIRVMGQVQAGSVDWSAKDLILRFTLVEGGATLPVVYQGVVPDTFKVGAEVVVEGQYTPKGLQANTLLAKCPSRYTPET